MRARPLLALFRVPLLAAAVTPAAWAPATPAPGGPYPQPVPPRFAPPPADAARPSHARYVELSVHPASNVWSAWLDNGARVHYRNLPQADRDAIVTIAFLGGELLETEANRGICAAAVGSAWSAGVIDAAILADGRLADADAVIDATARDKAIMLVISADPDQLAPAMRVARRLLSEPRVEPDSLERWKQRQRDLIRQRDASPESLLGRHLRAAIFPPDDPRARPIQLRDLDQLDAASVQAFLLGQIRSAPLEVAIVGNVPRDVAFELVGDALGHLPPRPRVSHQTLAACRNLPRREGPVHTDLHLPPTFDRAFVVVGCYGADERDIRDARALAVAARILAARAQRDVPDDAVIQPPHVYADAATTFPGFGLLLFLAVTHPDQADAVAATAQSLFDAFAAHGPSDAELQSVQRSVADLLRRRQHEPRFWAARLRTLEFDGRRLDEIVRAPEAYQTLTAEQVRETFARYYQPASTFRLIARPADQP